MPHGQCVCGTARQSRDIELATGLCRTRRSQGCARRSAWALLPLGWPPAAHRGRVVTTGMERRYRKPAIPAKAREAFLAALEDGLQVRSAARLAGVRFQRLYERRKVDEEFSAAWDEAYEQGTQAWEDLHATRTKEGIVEETTDADGKVIRRVRKPYPQDLHLMLKARRPEVYRENASVAVTVPTVFVMDSAFAGRQPVESQPRELTEGGTS